MSRKESILVAAFVGFACPATLFILSWWVAAALSVYRLLPLSEDAIAGAAFAGLAAGMALDFLCLKRWVAGFYNVALKWAAPVYLFWSLGAVALFMGAPFGNLVLGMFAGLYVGRRQHHAETSGEVFATSARRVSLFTAAVTGPEALAIGVLALSDASMLRALGAIPLIGPLVSTRAAAAAAVGLGCLLLALFQFYFTRAAAAFAFRLSPRAARAPST